MHTNNNIYAGVDISTAAKALILLHGRGAQAADILSLSRHLAVKDFALVAPQAANNTWYPHSFLAPPAQNEPWLSSAIQVVKTTVETLQTAGIENKNIYILGFSQGACLTLEFAARNAVRYGGLIAFTGGLIGDELYTGNYTGNFEGTPVFIGSSNPDFHVPVERVHATTSQLEKMGALVTEKIYNNMGHTINEDELDHANQILAGTLVQP